MFNNHQILVVDSDPNTLRIVKNALIQNGFVVHFSHNCEHAMQSAIKNDPDLILSEMALQDMDGLDFMNMVRKTPELNPIPFIFLTSRSLINDKVAALEGGADDYITKPFNENELIARINAVLRRTDHPRMSTLTKDDGIKGSLKEINLIDLIQLFDMGRKTAVIVVEGTEKQGRVYFELGEPVHAITGKLFGKEALFEILTIEEGTFLIHLNIRSKIRTIELSATNLIMEAVHRIDEKRSTYPGEIPGTKGPKEIAQYMQSDGIKELFEKGIIQERKKS